MSGALAEIGKTLGIGIIYKTSYDKANRTSASSERGLGLEAAASVFAEIKKTTGLATLTDVHDIRQCAPAAAAVDILQIPAFLCRQTDLLLAAGETGKPINVKKGQFLAPGIWLMSWIRLKIRVTRMSCSANAALALATIP